VDLAEAHLIVGTLAGVIVGVLLVTGHRGSGGLAGRSPGLRRRGRMVAVADQLPSPDAARTESVLEAVLERITYADEDTGYTIARVGSWPSRSSPAPG
jgi:hypothetical protein